MGEGTDYSSSDVSNFILPKTENHKETLELFWIWENMLQCATLLLYLHVGGQSI